MPYKFSTLYYNYFLPSLENIDTNRHPEKDQMKGAFFFLITEKWEHMNCPLLRWKLCFCLKSSSVNESSTMYHTSDEIRTVIEIILLISLLLLSDHCAPFLSSSEFWPVSYTKNVTLYVCFGESVDSNPVNENKNKFLYDNVLESHFHFR